MIHLIVLVCIANYLIVYIRDGVNDTNPVRKLCCVCKPCLQTAPHCKILVQAMLVPMLHRQFYKIYNAP